MNPPTARIAAGRRSSHPKGRVRPTEGPAAESDSSQTSSSRETAGVCDRPPVRCRRDRPDSLGHRDPGSSAGSRERRCKSGALLCHPGVRHESDSSQTRPSTAGAVPRSPLALQAEPTATQTAARRARRPPTAGRRGRGRAKDERPAGDVAPGDTYLQRAFVGHRVCRRPAIAREPRREAVMRNPSCHPQADLHEHEPAQTNRRSGTQQALFPVSAANPQGHQHNMHDQRRRHEQVGNAERPELASRSVVGSIRRKSPSTICK